MKKILLLTVILGVLIFITGCDNEEVKEVDYSFLDNPEIKLEISQNNHTVNFLIDTNIPLPIEVMAGLDLKGQNDNDIYIGSTKKITINKIPFEFSIDLTENKLPNGEYDASVNFYPSWGAINELAKKIENEISVTQDIIISNGYGTAEDRKEVEDNQLWIMENLGAGTERNINTIKSKIGDYEKIDVTENAIVIEAFYFPKADTTIFVSKTKNNIIIWKLGKQNSF